VSTYFENLSARLGHYAFSHFLKRNQLGSESMARTSLPIFSFLMYIFPQCLLLTFAQEILKLSVYHQAVFSIQMYFSNLASLIKSLKLHKLISHI
jgi:hypothetical protein